MTSLLKYFLIFFWLLFGGTLSAQNETSKWYFGIYGALDFMSSPPTLLANSSMSVNEGCASVADAAGNLLFYTDGETVWTMTHTVMANGAGLLGGGTTVQSSLVLKQPGSASLYYLFTMYGGSAQIGLHYSIIDMSLAAGMGSVTTKNAGSLYTTCTEQLTGARHCNGIDYWVVVHERGSSNFRSYLLTATGVSTAVVVSSAGSGYPNGTGYASMKISSGGHRLGAVFGATVEVFDFDPSTGVVSGGILLSNSGFNMYGCEFSRDGGKFYTTRTSGSLLQWDLCAGSATAIAGSQYASSFSNAGSLQLASDGNIYVSGGSYQNKIIGVIQNAHLPAPQFSLNTLSLAPNYCGGGLPNFVNSQFAKPPPVPPFTYTFSNSLCQAATFSTPVVPGGTVGPCNAVSYTLVNLQWEFNDPLSGAANTSTLASPVHAFTSPGTYTVKLILNYSCGGGSDTLRQLVQINQPCVSVASNSITCATLGSATITPLPGFGPYTYTWLPGNATGSTVGGINPGTHTLLFSGTSQTPVYSNTISFVSPVLLTGQVINQSQLPCAGMVTGTAAVVNLQGGSSTQYFVWTDGSTTLATQTVNTLHAGTWSVTVTDALTACQVHSVFTITQPPATTLNIVANTPSVCFGGSITLTGTNNGGTPGYSYQWINGPPGSSFTVSEAAGTYVYTLTSYDSNTCVITQTVVLDFVPNPVLSVADVSICPLETGTLVATGATNYTWNTGSNNASAADNPLVTTVYTVTGESFGCSAAASDSIILKTTPVVLISSNSPRCEGSTLNFITNGGSAFLWDGPQGFTSTLVNPARTAILPGHAGVYNVTVTAANNCTASASSTVVVFPTPTLSATGATVCSSQTLLLNASSVPGSAYQWNGPDSFSASQQNPTINNPLLSASGDYTVKVTSPQTCTSSTVVNALVVAPPSLTVALSSPSLCAQALNGSPNTITLTSTGADTYTLLTSAPLLNPDPTNTTVPISTNPPYYPTGISTATLLGSNGVCTVSLATTFSIIPNPTIGVNSFTPVICAGESFTYTSDGASSYVWNASTPNYTTWSNGGVAVANPSINSVLSVYGSSLGCNSALVTTSITVNPVPTVFANPMASSICKSSTGTLQASGSATEFAWYPAQSLNTANGEVVLASPTENQIYTVIGSALGCTNSALAHIQVLDLPVPVAQLSKTAFCISDEITLTGSGGVYFEWMGPNGFNYAGSPVSFSLGNSAFAGEYTVVATDSNNCKGSSKIFIPLHPLPQGTLKANEWNACVPFCSEFEFVPLNNAGLTASWQISNKNFKGDFSYCFTNAGEYIITGNITDPNTSCRSTQTFVVNGFEKPVADFTWSPEEPVEGIDDVLFINNTSGKEQTSWNWYFEHDRIFQPESENTSYSFRQAGTYPVIYVVENKWACADTVIKVLTIESDFVFYMPNAFTPNADSKNETFKPSVRGITKYYFQVFNRWGERLFVTENPEEGWDGSFQSQSCKQDSYVWKVVLTTGQGKQREYKGSVILIR